MIPIRYTCTLFLSARKMIHCNCEIPKVIISSLDLLILIGTFAVQTDHAVDADLSRHVSGFMTWWKYSVNLAWLGFADVHSDITHYLINVGSKYMGADLNAVS